MPATASTRAPGAAAMGPPASARSASNSCTTVNACGTPSVRATSAASCPAATSTASAARAASSGSRSRPDGSTRSCRSAGDHEQQVDVARQLQMLEPVVEQHARSRRSGARPRTRPDSDPRPTSTGTPGSARASICGSSPARATGSSTRSPSLTTTTPSASLPSRVAAAQDGWTLASREQQTGERGDDRRLAAAADDEIADADDRPLRAAGARCRPARVPGAAQRARRAVQRR